MLDLTVILGWQSGWSLLRRILHVARLGLTLVRISR
jgi:hypothetical protein